MVLEHIISTQRLERSPYLILFISFIFVSFAVFLTHYFYPNDHGMVVILLTILPAIPFFLNFIRTEEQRHEVESGMRHNIFHIYKPLISLYIFFFIGTALSFAFWASILPIGVSDSMFSELKAELSLVQGAVTPPALTYAGSPFEFILTRNLLVFALMILFSFIYSIGSIFLLTWNAALLGMFMEQSVRTQMLLISQQFGLFAYPVAFVMGSVAGLLSVLPHGIFELSAFFIASLAGGILSVALERGTYRRQCFWCIIQDASKLFILALVLLVIGAAIEGLYA
ncbi:MAG: stage II sporulation protein M [Candidatus Burarchaeum sp.]|nr:stage II sporulation protein M [Candidatus Burarchaeum sp.]MDO8339516.1 stage II sporulation protein M [Candidatus Burarchaeum sp.]